MKVKVRSLSDVEEQELIDEATGQSVLDHYQKLISFWRTKYASHKAMQNFLIKKQGQEIAHLKRERDAYKVAAEQPKQPRGPSFLEDEAKAWCEKYHQLRRETTEHDTIVRQFKLQIHHLEDQLEEYRRYFSQNALSIPKGMPIGNRSYNRKNKKKSKITSGKSKRRRANY